MAELTTAQVRRWRARSQGLADTPGGADRQAGGGGRGVLDAVRRAAALQAQDAKASRLQVRVRTGSGGAAPTAGDVEAACGTGRPAIVRTWLMRGTLHAVPAEDARWLTSLLGPRAADAHRGRRLRLGLDEELCRRALPALERTVAGGPPVARDELVARLAGEGIVLEPGSQAPAHLVLYAAALGVVCRGPQGPGDTSTYVLREEWLKDVPDSGVSGDEALAELAVRHVTAYGPASAADFARWSGLPLGQAGRGYREAGDRIAEVAGPDGPLWVAAGTGPPAALRDGDPDRVRLTGHFDPYLLGYRDRDLLLDPAFARRIATGGGLLMPCVLLDGAVVGTWRHQWQGRRLSVRVESLTGPASEAVTAGITAEVADLGRFLGVAADWEWSQGL